ncbi:MAG: hypothetical protein CVU65_17020 [Deltaproteobacteria bacterium HGW-Deltaproteobacteria-22]|nr:MAG: hypothetical protein CVU65_17020 [Deltaproteobacteria bacterium HGW-Deltaproteobacteria-22]
MSEVNILHISPQQFLEMSFSLGRKLFESGFRPKHTISVWRGGTPVGLGVDAYFRNRGIFMNHTTIATESYTGIGQQSSTVLVKGLEHVINVICREDDLLILDDVYESGRTIEAIVDTLRKRARANCPERIVVGTLHHKPEKQKFSGLPLVTVQELPGDVWIDYPHELADLVQDDHADDPRIRSKDARTWELLHAPAPSAAVWPHDEPVHWLTAQEVYYDAVELALQMARSNRYVPDVLIALWPGGIHAGLPIHEVYKYLQKKGEIERVPDHVSLNTTRTHQSFRDNIIGLPYLVDRIEQHHQVLIVDTAFRSGRLISDVITKLKEKMRRNLSLDRLRVATLYYNPSEDATWTVNPFVKEPHFYRHLVRQKLVYPHAVHRLSDPVADCRRLSPRLHDILFAQ